MNYQQKYLKYKEKYLNLKNKLKQFGGEYYNNLHSDSKILFNIVNETPEIKKSIISNEIFNNKIINNEIIINEIINNDTDLKISCKINYNYNTLPRYFKQDIYLAIETFWL